MADLREVTIRSAAVNGIHAITVEGKTLKECIDKMKRTGCALPASALMEVITLDAGHGGSMCWADLQALAEKDAARRVRLERFLSQNPRG